MYTQATTAMQRSQDNKYVYPEYLASFVLNYRICLGSVSHHFQITFLLLQCSFLVASYLLD